MCALSCSLQSRQAAGALSCVLYWTILPPRLWERITASTLILWVMKRWSETLKLPSKSQKDPDLFIVLKALNMWNWEAKLEKRLLGHLICSATWTFYKANLIYAGVTGFAQTQIYAMNTLRASDAMQLYKNAPICKMIRVCFHILNPSSAIIVN